MKIPEVFQKVFVEGSGAAQIVYVFVGEGESLHIVDHLLQPAADGVSAIVRVAAVESVKDDLRVFSGLEISLHHGEFIEICEQGEIHSTHASVSFCGLC